MRRFRQSAVGVLGDLLLALPFLARLLEWVLELRIIRVLLSMANLGQAVDFAIQHLENPGWLGKWWVQLAAIAVGLALIFWDRKRPSWLPSPEVGPAVRAFSVIDPIIPGLMGTVILLLFIGVNFFQGTLPGNSNSAPPSANPPKSDSAIFHLNDAKRYQLIKGLRTALPRTTCHAMLHEKPRSEWATDAWPELSEILFVANWWLEGARTTSAFFPNGITLFSSKDTGEGFSCAFRLSEMLASINNRATFRDNQTTPDLAACEKENPTHGCVEILIGEAPQ